VADAWVVVCESVADRHWTDPGRRRFVVCCLGPIVGHVEYEYEKPFSTVPPSHPIHHEPPSLELIILLPLIPCPKPPTTLLKEHRTLFSFRPSTAAQMNSHMWRKGGMGGCVRD